jgi:rhodanese-related sulfurtransferase
MVQEIDPQDLAQRMGKADSVYLLDVRQPWENEAAALPGSHLIPLNDLPARANEIKPPDGALVVVYCHHGMRSLSGAAFLQRLGLPNVASLAGGIDAWSVEVDPSVPRY